MLSKTVVAPDGVNPELLDLELKSLPFRVGFRYNSSMTKDTPVTLCFPDGATNDQVSEAVQVVFVHCPTFTTDQQNQLANWMANPIHRQSLKDYAATIDALTDTEFRDAVAQTIWSILRLG